MGEVIKIIKKISIDSKVLWNVAVELNHPLGPGGKRMVHIQTQRGRIELNEEAFAHLIGTVLDAEEKLRKIKDIDKHE